MKAPIQVQLGDRVHMRKPHPCGSDLWTVTRLGSDVALVCDKCGRKVELPRSKFNQTLKGVLPRPPQ